MPEPEELNAIGPGLNLVVQIRLDPNGEWWLGWDIFDPGQVKWPTMRWDMTYEPNPAKICRRGMDIIRDVMDKPIQDAP